MQTILLEIFNAYVPGIVPDFIAVFIRGDSGENMNNP